MQNNSLASGKTRLLVIDCNIDLPWGLCADFRRYISAECEVRRAPQRDLPLDWSRYSHVLISGSKTSCLDTSPWVLELIDCVKDWTGRGKPLLGVCFGHQILARAYGGSSVVRASKTPEIGWTEIEQTASNALFQGLSSRFYSFQSHFEEVAEAPKGFEVTAQSVRCEVQAIKMKDAPVFGIQFHPEKNAAEGQLSIDSRREKLPKGCIFNDGKADTVFNKDVATTLFKNFLATLSLANV